MSGNFKIILGLCLFVGCNRLKEREEIGKNIIDGNISLFISNLYGLPSKNAPIFIVKEVGKNDFVKEHCESIVEMGGLNLIENCKKDLFESINKEGFDINEKTKYISFTLDELSNTNNIKIKAAEASIREKEFIKVTFSNFFINHNGDKAFIIVQERDVTIGIHGGKIDIYFFDRKNSKWFFIKKHMLVTA